MLRFLICSALSLIALIIVSRWDKVIKEQSLPSCEMTYNYHQHKEQHSEHFPADTDYRLFLYRDGNVQHDPIGPPSTPVLFIPGNVGTFKQGNAFGAESARQCDRRKRAGNSNSATIPDDFIPARDKAHIVTPGLDWYLVDFKEELSAFHGEILERQVEYILSCLLHLKLLYNSKGSSSNGLSTAPASYNGGVILVGHSMGGLVARATASAAAMHADLGPDSVLLILTLATPHAQPPLPSHPSLLRFYRNLSVNQHGAAIDQAPLISISGGFNDSQVVPYMTVLQPGSSSAGLHTSMESIPGVWASVHHEGIVWCNQLLIKTVAMMMDVAGNISSRYSHSEVNTHPETASQGAAGQKAGQESGKSELLILPAQKAWVLKVAHQALLGSGSLHQHLMLHPWSDLQDDADGATSSSAPPEVGDLGHEKHDGTLSGGLLHKALILAEERECRGANLAWYLQYNTPKMVHKPMIKLKHSSIKASLGTTGIQFFWPLNHSAVDLDFLLLLSAAKPCEGFRVWIHHELSQRDIEEREALIKAKKGVESNSDGDMHLPSEGSARHVDVTALASKLPPVHAAGRLSARLWSEAHLVVQGKDYDATAAWALRLPKGMLQRASGITVWIGSLAKKKAFFLTAQLRNSLAALPPAPLTLKYASPLHVKKDSSLFLSLRLQLPDSSASSTWRRSYLVVTESRNEGMITGHNISKRKPATCAHALIALSHHSLTDGMSHLQSNLTSFSLEACDMRSSYLHSVGSAGLSHKLHKCDAILVLDPACSYTVEMREKVVTEPLHLLLGNLPLVWALAQALLLFAIATKQKYSSTIVINSGPIRISHLSAWELLSWQMDAKLWAPALCIPFLPSLCSLVGLNHRFYNLVQGLPAIPPFVNNTPLISQLVWPLISLHLISCSFGGPEERTLRIQHKLMNGLVLTVLTLCLTLTLVVVDAACNCTVDCNLRSLVPSSLTALLLQRIPEIPTLTDLTILCVTAALLVVVLHAFYKALSYSLMIVILPFTAAASVVHSLISSLPFHSSQARNHSNHAHDKDSSNVSCEEAASPWSSRWSAIRTLRLCIFALTLLLAAVIHPFLSLSLTSISLFIALGWPLKNLCRLGGQVPGDEGATDSQGHAELWWLMFTLSSAVTFPSFLAYLGMQMRHPLTWTSLVEFIRSLSHSSVRSALLPMLLWQSHVVEKAVNDKTYGASPSNAERGKVFVRTVLRVTGLTGVLCASLQLTCLPAVLLVESGLNALLWALQGPTS
ncbi:hypothetical protein CEUSTIGMA_g1573.t1 [Chlamydomonas eustigma]|uniref:GPI inositol-deacylase n=1 Tax=Chlamydomonas eustigma TaxID=1157962 RepID=A0A250WTG6_9CHLO|nr:hypothetical protein CEUSTIGMA_g1573.t1 [Chlamydomonas eustigma]|eukprot:GAX74124.1 hypothetical protein CEUSTIGMA_g1573.t1 [Chlamydomonas eustigma]